MRPSFTFTGAVAAMVAAGAVISTASSPAALTAVPHPGGRPPSAAEIQLGRSLFFETRLSSNDKVSCGTCHKPERGFADGLRVSVGVSGTPLKRHTPHLYNLAWNHTFFWDGRVSSLEEQAVAPIRNPDEMGMPADTAAPSCGESTATLATFGEVFPKSGVTMGNIRAAPIGVRADHRDARLTGGPLRGGRDLGARRAGRARPDALLSGAPAAPPVIAAELHRRACSTTPA
jgi:cytochrome c peroxidase